jgi:putative heme-binding domain-containing protein
MAQHGQYLNESKNPAIGDPAAIAAGAALWATSCSGCHGPDGSGGRGPNLVKRALWHPLSDEAVHRTIREGVPGTDMPPTGLSDEETWKLVAFVKAMAGPAIENNVPGDTETGRQIFWGAKAGCSGCHSIRGEGGRMGADLTDIGASRPLVLIKDAILEPSKRLSMAGQEGVTITLKDGKQIQGIARNRNNYSLQVLDKGGDLHLISMLDVEQLVISAHSPMPDDYGRRLSAKELQDLFAYLSRQTVRPAAAMEGKGR